MLAMATYGKKKRSILPSFSVLRDSDTEPKTRKEKAPRRGSKILSMPAFHDSNFNKQSPSNHHDDSIEEMASMLLDDTTLDQLKSEPGRRMSQIGTSKALPEFSRHGSADGKTLPQLPNLMFNGDDAWAMKTDPVVTAAGTSNHMDFVGDTSGPSGASVLAGHSRKDSAPSIPRKSSKRRSGRPKSYVYKPPVQAGDRRSLAGMDRQAMKDSISPPRPIETSQPKTSLAQATDVNGKIEAMIAATKALKPGSEVTIQESSVPTKKRRLMDNKVLNKMKSAINDRLQARSDRKRESLRGDRLLDSSLSELRDTEDEQSTSAAALSTMEIRMNEGDNFKNPKIYTLTGHGNVRRKPLADDGKSLKSRKSNDQQEDPFSESPQSGGITRTPTSFENRLKDDMSQSQGSEFIPDLPDLPSRCETPKRGLRERRIKTSLYGSDFDAMLSSSPFAQSTPRIRLEPTFEEGGKSTLVNVPADSHSLFDPDNSTSAMDIDSETSSTQLPPKDVIKRRTSSIKAFRMAHHNPKRTKKHPSPSKAELEGLEKALENFPSLGDSEDPPSHVHRPPPVENVTLKPTPSHAYFPMPTDNMTLKPATALAARDPNKRLRDTRRHALNIGSLKTTESMPSLSKQPKINKQGANHNAVNIADGRGRRYMSQNEIVDQSMMDVDELQWDDDNYDIGVRKM